MNESFADKLARAVDRNGSRLCVGLDPEHTRTSIDDVVALCRQIIEATADVVCCYKPNIAFYEAYGIEGLEALRVVLDAVPTGIPVLIDAKRGDVGNTAASYASALFDFWQADAVTVNPYLGQDSLEPFLSHADRGVFAVCRTSNPGAVDLQDLEVRTADGGSEPLYMAVAGRLREWNRHGNAGLVVGATYPRELARLRERCPEMPILVPGVGAQEGALEASAVAADNGSLPGFLISASRAVMYAANGTGRAEAARAAATTLRDRIEAALSARTAGTAG